MTSAARWLVSFYIVATLFSAGCNLGGGPPPPGGQLAIENVAKWYQLYRTRNRGKPPKDEEAFIKFVENEVKGRGDAFDADEFLTSPRDGQKFVIQYGKGNSKNIERNVAVYEKEGYGGKKLVAFEAAWAKEVDDAELQSLLAAGD